MSNDMIIIGTLLILFVGMGFIVANINDAFDATYTGGIGDTGDLTATDEGDFTTISAWKIFTSVLSMFFWTFGALPVWLDLLFWIFRAVFYLTIARNIWIGGGS